MPQGIGTYGNKRGRPKKVKVSLGKFRKERKDAKSVKPTKAKGRPDFFERAKKIGKR